MINSDTIDLLQQCNLGIKMGVTTIDDVLDKVDNDTFRSLLCSSKEEHQRLGSETHEMLNNYQDEAREPSPMAKTMSWMKSNIMISMKDSDNTIADLVTDGCNMGVKTLNKYLNQYTAAEERAKDVAKKLINMEEKLAVDIRQYL
ncbi:MAG: hypothetical protein ACI4RS_02980 [Monoglobaceae bacterium]